MTVRLSAMFEEHIKTIIHNWNAATKRDNIPNTRSNKRLISNTEEESSKSSDSDESYEETKQKIRYRRKPKPHSSNDSSSSSSDEKNSSDDSSATSDSSDSSDNKPLQRPSFANGHKKYDSPCSESENDSDYKPLSSLKRNPRSCDKKVIYNESSDSGERQMTISTRTRNLKRPRTISDSSDSDNTNRDKRSALVTVSSRGRVRKLTPKVRAFLEK